MTDVDTSTEPGQPATDEAPIEVTPEDMISRGKGMSLEAVLSLEDGAPAKTALAEFTDLSDRHKAAAAEEEALKVERNEAILALKDNHNIGFSAIAEVIGNTSSLVLYLYQRAQGMTAKEIRDASVKSRLAKEKFQESDPNKPKARKQTPEEKSFRKQQRDALKAFLASQREAGANDEISDDEVEPEPDEGDEG